MSGTSLDGLDVALCRFEKNDHWTFEILDAKTFEYDLSFKKRLSEAHLLSAEKMMQLHVDVGVLHANMVRDFLSDKKIEPDFISSHGHTVFHQPKNGFTLQIGSPQHIASITQLPVVADFRTMDVALGGQGAPLVPIGDLLLFSQYDACLNLGGIANVSLKKNDSIIAFDICHCNMVLNYLAEKLGLPYDKGGEIARSGNVISNLSSALDNYEFYQWSPPKSLGKESFENFILPILSEYDSIPDVLATFSHHIAEQISKSLTENNSKVLVTGGGAFNHFLMQLIQKNSLAEIVIPDALTVQFKEALIFGFLGTLKWRNEVNCLSSVTGASRNHCSGIIVTVE